MKGRKRKPTHMNLVEMTARKDRQNKNEPRPAPDLPTAPFCPVLPRCSVLFGMIVGWLQRMGLASSSDTVAISLLAMRLEEIEQCAENIQANGSAYAKIELIEVPVPDNPGKTAVKAQEVWKSNPAVAQRAEAMRHAQSLISEFGLSPAARAKVSAILGVGGEKKAGNPWESIANA